MPNRLALAASPYLRQYADQPVDWYPWGEEAFARAMCEDKPIHLSIGYFACHWCHVMAHESYEDPQIARILNANFVNIKVDRQERPDIDELYQRVVQLMGEGGGWPLTVFLTPRQEPYFAGTYFPPQERYGRPAFPRLLQGLARAWRERRHEVEANCEQFLRGLREADERLFAGEAPPAGDLALEAAMALARGTDPVHGGLGGAPKFPNASCLDLMLRVLARTRDPSLAQALRRSLEGMARGGIQDHLGGGFARYSVDARWAVPHFEKMLYDNAQLAKLYADAYRHDGAPAWREVFERTCDYVLRELRHAQGAFCASEDADSEGAEGRFYTWTEEEIAAALGADDGAFACRAYSVGSAAPAAGVLEGRYVLQRSEALTAPEEARLAPLAARLHAARARRARPARDENVLAGWNGLMIQGLCAAYQAGGELRYLQAAQAAADFVARHLVRDDGRVARSWRDGVAGGSGFLDDYACLAHAHFDLYESAFVRTDLDRAVALCERILGDFGDDDGQLYFTPRGAAPLVQRPLAPHDGACASGLSSSVHALLRAADFTGRADLRAAARGLLERYEGASARNFFGFAHLLAARERERQGATRIVFAGDADSAALERVAQRSYLPARVLARAGDIAPIEGAAPARGHAAAWVCRGGTCLPPAGDEEGLRALLRAGAPAPVP